ncbi:hypothetical protein EDC04DRAFT_2605808 [Pisolithus marmoratus]|nr:hypothetical protein EDC04DRAFT_2605808 [Pisolithus marmoratus]
MSFNFKSLIYSVPQYSTPQLFNFLSTILPHSPTLQFHNLLADEAVPPHFIDAFANQFRFGDGEQDLQQNLFKLGGPTVGVTSAHNACLAILHHFSLENPGLLDHEEELNEEPPFQDEELAHSTSAEPPRKKQKHGGHVPKGEDFWSQTSPGWTSYIAETIAKDEQHFQPQVIHNPFMEDVTTDDSYLTGPTGSFVVCLGAIEDLLQAMT